MCDTYRGVTLPPRSSKDRAPGLVANRVCNLHHKRVADEQSRHILVDQLTCHASAVEPAAAGGIRATQTMDLESRGRSTTPPVRRGCVHQLCGRRSHRTRSRTGLPILHSSRRLNMGTTSSMDNMYNINMCMNMLCISTAHRKGLSDGGGAAPPAGANGFSVSEAARLWRGDANGFSVSDPLRLRGAPKGLTDASGTAANGFST